MRSAKMPQVDFEESGTAGANTGVLKRGIKQKLQRLTETIAETAAVERPVRVTRKLKILELFTWTMAMSMAAAERTWQVMEPISTISGWDIRKKEHPDSAMAYLDRENPDMVVAAWPCSTDSQMQNLNAKRPGYAEMLAETRAENEILHKFAWQVYKRQKEAGKDFVGENPTTSKCWKRPVGEKMLQQTQSTDTDMCRWNLTDPETGLFIRKGTNIVSTSAAAAENVSHKCPKNHSHRRIGGTIRYKGERMNMSTYAGGYTPDFCKAVIEGVENTVNQKMVEAYAVTGFSADKNAQRRRALDGNSVYDEAKAGRLASIGDVPTSIRRNISRAQAERRREVLDDVPLTFRNSRLPTAKRELLDDVPLTIRSATRSNQQQHQEPKRRRIESAEPIPQHPPEQQAVRRLRKKQWPPPEWQEKSKTEAGHSCHSMLRAALLRGRNNSSSQEDPSANKRRVGENSTPDPDPDGGSDCPTLEPGDEDYPEDDPDTDEEEKLFGHPDQEEADQDLNSDIAVAQKISPSNEKLEPDPCPHIPAEVENAVRAAHRNLAHPARDVFVRMLRLGGAAQESIEYAREWKCAICIQAQVPGHPRPAKVCEVHDCNDTVALDILEIEDSEGNKFAILSMVCWGSRYHVAVIMPDKSNRCGAKAFARFLDPVGRTI